MLAQISDFKRIAAAPGRLELTGAPEGFDALAMADMVKARGGLSLFVARDTPRASAFIDALAFFAREIEVVRLPNWDCLPYDRIGPSPAVAAQRMAALSRLAQGSENGGGGKAGRLLVTTVPGLLQRTPPRMANSPRSDTVEARR